MPRLAEVFLSELKEDLDLNTSNPTKPGKRSVRSKPSKSYLQKLTEKTNPEEKTELPERLGPHLPKAIIKKANGRLRYGGRKAGAYRIQRTNPKVGVPTPELKQIFDELGFKTIQIIPPGAPGASSGKFNTYIMQYGELEFPIVFGQGRNGGQRYEDQVLKDLKKSREAEKKENMSELYKALLDAFGIDTSEVKEIKKVASKAVRRPVTTEIQDVGSIVSDIDIILDNDSIIHISLKDLNGSTFANSGYTGGIQETLGKDQKPFFMVGSHELDGLLAACGVDKQKVADGLNDYVREQQTNPPFKDVPTEFNAGIIMQYLASAYGYGYWYVRPNRTSRGGGFQIVHIRTPEDALKKVGDINSVTVTYPYWTPKMKSKQVTIKIDTDIAYYKIEIRNSHRKVIPNEFKIKIERLKL